MCVRNRVPEDTIRKGLLNSDTKGTVGDAPGEEPLVTEGSVSRRSLAIAVSRRVIKILMDGMTGN